MSRAVQGEVFMLLSMMCTSVRKCGGMRKKDKYAANASIVWYFVIFTVHAHLVLSTSSTREYCYIICVHVNGQ